MTYLAVKFARNSVSTLMCSTHISIILGIIVVLVWGIDRQLHLHAESNAHLETASALERSFDMASKMVSIQELPAGASSASIQTAINDCVDAYQRVQTAQPFSSAGTSRETSAYLANYADLLNEARQTLPSPSADATAGLRSRMELLQAQLRVARGQSLSQFRADQVEAVRFGRYLAVGLGLMLLIESFCLFLPMAISWRKSKEALERKAEKLSQSNEELTAMRDSLLSSQSELEEHRAQLQEYVQQQEVHLELLQMGTARFQGLFQHLPAVCFTTDVEGNIFEWNSEAERSLGHLGFALFERSLFDILVPEEGRTQWQHTFDELSNGSPVRFQEHLVTHMNGTVQKMLVSAFGIKGAGGVISSYVFSGITIHGSMETGIELAILKEALEHVPDGVCITDENLVIEFVNSGFVNCTGFSSDELIGQKPGNVLHGKLTDGDTKTLLRSAIEQRQLISTRILNYHKSGEPYWADLRIVPYEQPGSNKVRFLGFHSKVSEATVLAEELLHREQLFDAVMNHFKTGLLLLDSRGRIITANQSAAEITGIPREELSGQRPWRVFDLLNLEAQTLRAEMNPFVRITRRGELISGETYLLRNQDRHVRIEGIPVAREQDRSSKSILVFVDDVTEEVRHRRHIEQYLLEISEQNVRLVLDSETSEQEKTQLEELARIDELTQILNRRGFKHDVQKCLLETNMQAPASLVMIDIDHFKSINDTFGHATGDAALREVANKLTALTGDSDVVGRLSGDEFAMFVRSMDPSELRNRIQSSFPFQLETPQGPQSITLSVGMLTIAGTATYEEAMARADDAVYESKRSGRNRITLNVFDRNLGDQAA